MYIILSFFSRYSRKIYISVLLRFFSVAVQLSRYEKGNYRTIYINNSNNNNNDVIAHFPIVLIAAIVVASKISPTTIHSRTARYTVPCVTLRINNALTEWIISKLTRRFVRATIDRSGAIRVRVGLILDRCGKKRKSAHASRIIPAVTYRPYPHDYSYPP